MKFLKIMSFASLVAFSVSCGEGNENNEKNNEKIDTVVEMETITEYSEDSTSKKEYQIDINTKMKHGVYQEFDETGLVHECNYKQNKMDGTEKFFYPGTDKAESEFIYKEGLLDGPFNYYFETGKVKQKGVYTKDKVEGKLMTYYEDGTLKEEVMHIEGVTQGPFKEYNENGTLKAEGAFTSKGDTEDLEHGLLKMYDEKGSLNKKMVCKEGQCCTTWTLEDGDVSPSSKLCEAIISGMSEESTEEAAK